MNQHDSQEFLSRLIDGLHEDLNLIKKKPYIEGKDYSADDNGPALARQFWVDFLRRNYSKLIELFYGQFFSQVECPKCGKKSVRYDPFELISLPLPKPDLEKNFNAFEISVNQDKQAEKAKFEIKGPAEESVLPTHKEVIEHYTAVKKEATKEDLKPNQFFLAFSGFSAHGDVIPLNASVEHIEHKSADSKYKPKLFLFQKSAEEIAEEANADFIQVIALQTLREEESRYSYNDVSYPGFSKFIFANERTTIEQLYYLAFLKYAHFINLEGGSPSTSDYPKPVSDYRKLFESTIGSKQLKTNFIFKIVIEDETVDYPLNCTKTLKEIIPTLKNDKRDYKTWDEKVRTLKIELRLDSYVNKNSVVILDAMKKVAGNETDVKVTWNRASCDPDEKNLNLSYLLRRFTKSEVLDDENLYRCVFCKESTNGIREIKIYKLPKYLIINMKKLKDSSSYWSSSDKHLDVKFPLTGLDMTPFCVSKEPIECYNVDKKEFMDEGNEKLANRIVGEFHWEEGKPLLYDCVGVINHYGSMHFGHYKAYAKNAGKWYCFDDSTVSSMEDPESVVTDAAYCIFYERRD